MQFVSNVLDSLNSFNNKTDGTYSLITGELVEYTLGFQVSFVRPEAFEQLTRHQWDLLSNYFCVFLDSIVHIGVYCGGTEVSYHCIEKAKALITMEEFNQESILDWESKCNYPNDFSRWFILNRKYDEKMEVNYNEFLTAIQ